MTICEKICAICSILVLGIILAVAGCCDEQPQTPTTPPPQAAKIMSDDDIVARHAAINRLQNDGTITAEEAERRREELDRQVSFQSQN